MYIQRKGVFISLLTYVSFKGKKNVFNIYSKVYRTINI